MQQPAPPTQGFAYFSYPQPCYPPPGLMYPPPQFQPWGFPNAYNPYPGSVFNSGGNTNGSGTQTNGDVKVGNHKQKTGGLDIGSIGGNHGNNGGQQVSGDVKVGDINSDRH